MPVVLNEQSGISAVTAETLRDFLGSFVSTVMTLIGWRGRTGGRLPPCGRWRKRWLHASRFSKVPRTDFHHRYFPLHTQLNKKKGGNIEYLYWLLFWAASCRFLLYMLYDITAPTKIIHHIHFKHSHLSNSSWYSWYFYTNFIFTASVYFCSSWVSQYLKMNSRWQQMIIFRKSLEVIYPFGH